MLEIKTKFGYFLQFQTLLLEKEVEKDVTVKSHLFVPLNILYLLLL